MRIFLFKETVFANWCTRYL